MYVVGSTFISSLLKPAQALSSLDPTSPAFRKCLRELRNISGTRWILPTSYTLPLSVVSVGRQPVASGGSGRDIYEGSLNGLKICVKRVRIYSKDGPKKAIKVRHQRHRSPCLLLLMRLTDHLPGGHRVETFDTPKHSLTPGCHPHPPPAYIGMDARW